MRSSSLTCYAALAWAAIAISSPIARALEYVQVERNERQREIVGELLAEGRDGSMIIKTADGAFHRLDGEEVKARKSDDKPLEMFDADQLEQQLLAEMSSDFLVHQSKNYVVCYNTTSAYAKWTSSLLERLQQAFIFYWKKMGCDVKPPEQPLVVLVFSDQASYAEYAHRELGAAVSSVIGYYSPENNRIIMYDLTGRQAERLLYNSRGSRRDISALLAEPAAEPLVATIVHEATHQISFNCGLQTRLADNPVWLSEGLAVFCETPDLSSARTWRGIGNVNYPRWDLFRSNYVGGRSVSVERMIANDELFRDRETAVDCYAQAWAWNYFLIKWRPKEYAEYLKLLASQRILVDASPRKRIADFQKCFGRDFDALEDEFYRRMNNIQ